MHRFPGNILAILATATLASATPEFFVFDNGLPAQPPTTTDTRLDLVKSAGFDGLSWRVDVPETVGQILDGAKRRGLKVHAIYANIDLKDGRPVLDPRLKEIITRCKGAGTVIWPTITSKDFKNSDPAGDDIAVAGLRELAGLSEASGLRVAIYPHVGLWCHRVEDALRLAKKVNRPDVGLTFNLCHALMDGAEDRIPALLEEVAPHLLVVSINGADSHAAERTWPHLIRPLGQGTYDVGIVLRKLEALGYKGPVGLQCYNVTGDPAVHLPASVAAWRKLNGPSAP